MVTFRWIEGKELDRLKTVMENHGWTPLDPIFSKALIAEDESGEIVGFNVLQVVLRPEPLWVEPMHRGRGDDLAMQLSTRMISHLRDSGVNYWEIRAKSPYVERLCEANGMIKIEVPMFAGGVE
jgi:hypothetical protein